jgi:hypothetical protein
VQHTSRNIVVVVRSLFCVIAGLFIYAGTEVITSGFCRLVIVVVEQLI